MTDDNIQDIESIDEDASASSGFWHTLLIILLGIVLFILVVSSAGQGEAPLINDTASLYKASAENDDIEKVMRLPSAEWTPVVHSNFALSPRAHWFKAPIPVNSGSDARLLEVSFASLDFVDVWFVSEENNEREILKHIQSGDNFKYSQREIRHDQFIFPVPESRNITSLYLRIKSEGEIKVPIKLWEEEEYIQYIASHRVFMGIFYGFMAAMALISLFLFVTSRNIITLQFAGFIACLSLALASSQGLGYRFIWPGSIFIQQYSLIFFASSIVFFSSTFTANLLEIRLNFKRLHILFKAIRISILIYIVFIFVLPFSLISSILALLILITIFLVFSSTLYIAYRGSFVARFLAAAWCSILFSGLFILADVLGLLSLNIDPSYLIMVGAVIETLFMALGLAMHFNQQRLDAKRAHYNARENKQKAMQANEELLRLQLEAKEKLEYAVDERNYELEIAMRELNEANHELERKSSIDALTGVANRRLYDKRVIAEARRSRREQTPLAIAMIDIDHFKSVNDNYGHQCGDEALKHFAEILKQCIKRPSDIICRYGGEEFVAILPNTDLAGAEALMETLRSATESSQLTCEEETIKFTVSIGVSTRIIASEEEAEMLHAFADKLLYKAKEAGRNQVMSAEF
ncbi:diguanylate cyclase [Glaciecola sp. MF2-115]|uniref:sensor domain-containing diguanylate cyclase n=1 Tax=Glaciecola sp. MF2-115 TaxID=3384827 RepID=UPI0039A3ED24